MKTILRTVFIVALLGVAAFLAYRLRAIRVRNDCVNNMMQFDSAKGSYGLANGLAPGTPVSPQDITDYIKGGWEGNPCLAGGIYEIGPFTRTKGGGPPEQAPSCSVHGPLAVALSQGYRLSTRPHLIGIIFCLCAIPAMWFITKEETRANNTSELTSGGRANASPEGSST